MALHLLGAGPKGRERASDQHKRVISYVRFGGSRLSPPGHTHPRPRRQMNCGNAAQPQVGLSDRARSAPGPQGRPNRAPYTIPPVGADEGGPSTGDESARQTTA
jgi:hypothetical protein